MFLFKAVVSILAVATIAVEAVPPRPEVDRFRALKHRTPEVYTTCKKKGHAALTIDDGAWIYLKDFVDTFKKAGVKGTFFFNGPNWGCTYDYKDAILDAYKSGMQIGSHTWAHLDLATLTEAEINNQMKWGEEVIKNITGAEPQFTRLPFGSYNDLVLKVAKKRGQVLVNWNFASGDADWNPLPPTAEVQKASFDEFLATKPHSVISLQHENYESTFKEVLPYMIQKLKAAGYKLVTVAECIGEKPYRREGKPPRPPTGGYTCTTPSA